MSTANTGSPFQRPQLPIAHLESLKFKANQITESIQLLQRTLEAGGQNAMPAWPDILSKYNILLSQSHNLSTSLLGLHVSNGSGTRSSENPYEKITLHPTSSMTDAQLDNELLPLLRTAQTTEVIQLENDLVRQSSEHLASKGILEVLREAGNQAHLIRPNAYDATLRECDEIRMEHDTRVERAVRAVAMLREKYDWKARVAVDQEEPEELDWDPMMAENGGAQDVVMDRGSEDGESTHGGQSNDSDEEEELEEVLRNGADQTPDGTPGGGGPASPMIEG